MLYRLAVETAELIGLFDDLAVDFLDTCVETVGDGGGVVGFLDLFEISFYLGLCKTFVVEVASRRSHEVGACCLVDALGIDRGIEYDLYELFGICRCCAFGQSCQPVGKELAAESRCELVGGVVVVYAVTEPYLFEICLEGFIVGVVLVAVVVGVHSFEHVADGEVLCIVLVEEYVATPQSGFLKVVYEYFLVEAQTVEVGHLVA